MAAFLRAGRAATAVEAGAPGRPQSFLQARPGQQGPPSLPGLDASSRLLYVGLGGSSASAGR